MAKPPKPGKCVHCLQSPVNRNWDHVFPESWYPDSTPKNLEKWKIPSCIECNRSLGSIEQEFLIRIARCLDPSNPASRSIVQKADRSMDPKFGKNASDKRMRKHLRERINSEFLRGDEIPNYGTYPSLGPKSDQPLEARVALMIPESSFKKITEKIIRGITYWESKQFIEPPHYIHFFALDDHSARPVRDLLEIAGTSHSREPGITVRRVITPEDGVSALYEIEFWKQFYTHATVMTNLAS